MGGVDGQTSELVTVLQKYRQMRNMSAERLSILLGKSNSYVTQIETGARGKRISRDTVLGLAQHLRAPVDEFLRAAGMLGPGEVLNEGRPTFEEFVNGDQALRTDQRRVLIDLYRSWVGRSAP